MKQLKEEIKKLSAEQTNLKQQRKTIHLKGQRTIEPYKANEKHTLNRWEIFHLLLAYAKLRNREDRMKLKEGTKFNVFKVQDLVKKYGMDVCPDKG